MREVNIEKCGDFGNNEKYFIDIYKFIMNFKNPIINGVLCVKGPKGCGKSEFVKYICKRTEYKIKQINFEELTNKIKKINKNQKKKEEIKMYLNNLINTYDILSSLMGEKIKNLIVIDKNEMLNFSKYKQLIISILKANNESRICPIIIIYDNTLNKDNENIENIGTEKIYLEEPDEKTIYNYLNKYCKINEIIIDDKVINEFIKNTTHNFNKIKISFKNFILLYKDKIDNKQKINLNDYIEYNKINQDEEKIQTIYSTAEELLTSYKNLQYANKLFSNETTMIPLLIQQYYYDGFNKNLVDLDYSKPNFPPIYNDENKKIINYYKNAINNISYGNMFDNYIHNEQKWKLTSFYSYFSTSSISYYINKINKFKVQINYNKFPYDLNKSSMTKLNYNHIKTMYYHFNILSIDNYLYLFNILLHLCISSDINNIKNFCKFYKLSSFDFENIIKINKLIDNDIKNKYINTSIKNIIDGKDKIIKSKKKSKSKSSISN